MQNFTLPHKLESGRSWTEELPPGSHQRATGSFGYDNGSAVLNIKINGHWENLTTFGDINNNGNGGAIAQIVGFSTCVAANGTVFNPNDLSAQGPYKLRRRLPARHPRYKSMFATKILSVQGVKPYSTHKDGGGGNVGEGHIGAWQYVYISILFELPRYSMLDDAGLEEQAFRLGAPAGSRPEYLRYTEWKVDENVETLARKGETYFLNPALAGIQSPGQSTPQFVGDMMRRQAKTTFRIITYDVHQDFVMLGRIAPVNSIKRNATLNARPFPNVSYRDQNQAGNASVYFEPGTLLLMPSKFTSHAQCHPAVLAGEIGESFFPRTVDCERTMIYFAPSTNDTTHVNLSDPKYGYAGGLGAAIPVRGHNLVPVAKPTNGNLWLAAVRGIPGSNYEGTVTDDRLLYQYSDFEKLWAPVDSLSTPA